MRQINAYYWDARSIAKLRELWSTDLTCAEIAGKISRHLTKNSVIGKAHRLGLPQRRRSPSIYRRKLREDAETRTAEDIRVRKLFGI